jgi:hypothetical protein
MQMQRTINKLVEAELKQEIKKGVQTIQYQILTLMTTQGQTPFITVYMYIDEVPEGQLRDDLVMVIEEVIRQRTEGIKDKLGKFIHIRLSLNSSTSSKRITSARTQNTGTLQNYQLNALQND